MAIKEIKYTTEDEVSFLKSLKKYDIYKEIQLLSKYEKSINLRKDWSEIDVNEVRKYIENRIIALTKKILKMSRKK